MHAGAARTHVGTARIGRDQFYVRVRHIIVRLRTHVLFQVATLPECLPGIHNLNQLPQTSSLKYDCTSMYKTDFQCFGRTRAETRGIWKTAIRNISNKIAYA